MQWLLVPHMPWGPVSGMGGNLLFAPIAMFGKSEFLFSRWGERPREPDLYIAPGFGGLSILMDRVLEATVFGQRLAGTLAPPLRYDSRGRSPHHYALYACLPCANRLS